MKLDWATIPRPIIALSPMADMTDSAFCRVVRKISGPDVIVFREMVSSEAIIRGNDKTLGMTEIHEEERPIVQQIFGSEPEKMAEAARIIDQDHAPEGFDINMGCPVYKVTHSFNGASLMKDAGRASAIVQAVKDVTDKPVSVKIRAGWEDPRECLTFGTVLQEAGADLITIHGRTKKQGYTGQSDWDLIGEFVKTVSIPVLANGDIYTPQLMTEALDTSGAAGALIARGALGNPWIFKQIQDSLEGKEVTPIALKERIDVIRQHVRWHIDQFDQGYVRTFRKHLSWYFRAIPGAKPYKARLHTVDTLEELDAVLDELLADGLNGEALSRRDASHPLAADRLFISK
jgi:tRNA-dihydrouridine synthase B